MCQWKQWQLHFDSSRRSIAAVVLLEVLHGSVVCAAGSYGWFVTAVRRAFLHLTLLQWQSPELFEL
jgi:hypothetical protein